MVVADNTQHLLWARRIFMGSVHMHPLLSPNNLREMYG